MAVAYLLGQQFTTGASRSARVVATERFENDSTRIESTCPGTTYRYPGASSLLTTGQVERRTAPAASTHTIRRRIGGGLHMNDLGAFAYALRRQNE